MQRSALGRSRRELFEQIANSNEYLLAKIGFDTAENEPLKVRITDHTFDHIPSVLYWVRGHGAGADLEIPTDPALVLARRGRLNKITLILRSQKKKSLVSIIFDFF